MVFEFIPVSHQHEGMLSFSSPVFKYIHFNFLFLFFVMTYVTF